MASSDEPSFSRAELADLSALADGSLDPERRGAVRARIAASPELRERYARERRVVEVLDEARRADRAPLALRERIEASRPRRASAARRRGGYAAVSGAAIAALALIVVLVVPGGTPGGPSLSEAATLAVRGPSAPAPAPDADHPGSELDQRMQGLYFPNWATTLGWRAVGRRADTLHGRRAVTVYYAWHGRRVAYTIVAGPALAAPSAPVTRLNGYELRTLRIDGRSVVTWRRSGHTCVLSAQGVRGAVLRALAAWRGDGNTGG